MHTQPQKSGQPPAPQSVTPPPRALVPHTSETCELSTSSRHDSPLDSTPQPVRDLTWRLDTSEADMRLDARLDPLSLVSVAASVAATGVNAAQALRVNAPPPVHSVTSPVPEHVARYARK